MIASAPCGSAFTAATARASAAAVSTRPSASSPGLRMWVSLSWTRRRVTAWAARGEAAGGKSSADSAPVAPGAVSAGLDGAAGDQHLVAQVAVIELGRPEVVDAQALQERRCRENVAVSLDLDR